MRTSQYGNNRDVWIIGLLLVLVVVVVFFNRTLPEIQANLSQTEVTDETIRSYYDPETGDTYNIICIDEEYSFPDNNTYLGEYTDQRTGSHYIVTVERKG